MAKGGLVVTKCGYDVSPVLASKPGGKDTRPYVLSVTIHVGCRAYGIQGHILFTIRGGPIMLLREVLSRAVIRTLP